MPNPYIDVPDNDELSNEQLEIYGYALNYNLIINGAAGSGKTILAIHRAKQLAEAGKSVLFIVFNNVLKDYTTTAMQEFGVGDRVKLKMPTDICNEVLGRKKLSKYLTNRDRERMINACNYDAIIIDEAQDFDIIDIDMFKNFADNVTICCDRKQGIFERDFTIPGVKDLFNDDIEEKFLMFTYRNPKNILKLSVKYYYQKYNVIPAEQEQNRIHCYNETNGKARVVTTNNEIDTIQQLISNAPKGDTIGIIVPRAEAVKYISEALSARGVVNEKYYSVRVPGRKYPVKVYDLSFSENKLKIVTLWSSKGIQFDTVIIPFMDKNTSPEFSEWTNRAGEGFATYVAMTRPKNNLYFTKTSEYSFPSSDYLDEEHYEEITLDQSERTPDSVFSAFDE